VAADGAAGPPAPPSVRLGGPFDGAGPFSPRQVLDGVRVPMSSLGTGCVDFLCAVRLVMFGTSFSCPAVIADLSLDRVNMRDIRDWGRCLNAHERASHRILPAGMSSHTYSMSSSCTLCGQSLKLPAMTASARKNGPWWCFRRASWSGVSATCHMDGVWRHGALMLYSGSRNSKCLFTPTAMRPSPSSSTN
jgi:hypothetical protein